MIFYQDIEDILSANHGTPIESAVRCFGLDNSLDCYHHSSLLRESEDLRIDFQAISFAYKLPK